jgi:hypothetical protein
MRLFRHDDKNMRHFLDPESFRPHKFTGVWFIVHIAEALAAIGVAVLIIVAILRHVSI